MPVLVRGNVAPAVDVELVMLNGGEYLAAGNTTANTPSYAFDDGFAGTGMYSPSANTLAFSTAGIERLRVDQSGNFIATTANLSGSLSTPIVYANLSGQTANVSGSLSTPTVYANLSGQTANLSGSLSTPIVYANLSGQSATVGTLTTTGNLTSGGWISSSGSRFYVTSVGDNQGTGGPWYGLGFAQETVVTGDGNVNPVQLAGWYGVNLRTAGGKAILTNAGNFGVDTFAPSTKLQVGSTADNVYWNNPLANCTVAMVGSARASPTTAGTTDMAGTLFVNVTDAYALNRGASIALGGRAYDFGGGSQHMSYARLSGVQTTTTNGFAGDFVIETMEQGSLYEALRINNSRYVGIGCNAGAPFHIYADATRNNLPVIRAQAIDQGSPWTYTAFELKTGAYVHSIQQNLSEFNFVAKGDTSYGNMGFFVGDGTTRAMTIGYNACVGIGTGSPSYALDIGGFSAATQTLRLTSLSNTEIQFREVADSYGFTLRNVATSRFAVIRHSANSTGTEAMCIVRDTGAVGIGTTSPLYDYKLHVVGPGYFSGDVIINPTSTTDVKSSLQSPGAGLRILNEQLLLMSGYRLVWYYNWAIRGNNGTSFQFFYGSNPESLTVSVAYITTGGVFTTGSDARLKRDVQELPYGLQEILQLQPKWYFMENDPATSTKRHPGLLAQDVIDIIPEVVGKMDAEEDGNDPYLGLAYTELIPVLINAIKQQQQLIENLQHRVQLLES